MEFSILSMLISILCVPFGMVILLLLFIIKKVYSFWDKFDIPVIPAQIPYGSLGDPFTEAVSVNDKIADAYRKFKDSNHKYGGIYIYLVPYYLPIDPAIIKNILIKDFDYFSERDIYHNKKKDPLSVHLLSVDGEQWRDMRNKLTPIFTIHKLKLMFPLFKAYSDRLVMAINDYISRMEPIMINDLLGRFTTDIIGSSSFGIECNSLENPNHRLRTIGKIVVELTPFRLLKAQFTRQFPNLSRSLGVVTFNEKLFDYIIKVVNESFDYRIKNNVKFNDIFQSLIELEKNESDDKAKKINIAAQSFLFLNAGAEPAAVTATLAIYELARNPEIQDTLRKEVTSVLEKYNGIITYDALMEMQYLTKVISETLRKYPPTPAIIRRCVQDYHVEGTDFVIKKGVKVLISILALHRDPEYYPDPEVFDPERFNEENKSKRPSCTYMPFLDGPRNCIGVKLALILMKVGLISILKSFKFSVNSKTEVPTFASRASSLRFSKDVCIDFEKY